MSFFDWIRDGVKQSVLLGLNDAVEQIGTPGESGELHPNMVALLDGGQESNTKTTKRKRGGTAASRKRLGKSLKEMNATEG